MSSGPTDRRRRALALGLAAAALSALPAPAPARGDGGGGDRPVFFRNPDRETAQRILDSISLFGSPSPVDRERARDALFDIGYWSVPRLLEAVRDKQAQFRSNALLVLGRLADPRAADPVRGAMGDEVSEWPPAVAALVLGRLRDGSDPSLAAFREALSGRENNKRKVAVALALGRLHRRRPAEGAELLELILDRPTSNPPVHYAALLALGFYRSRVAEPSPDGTGFVPSKRIREALADSRAGMRLSAVLALALSSQDAFHPLFLETFREDGDEEVRRAALLALGRNEDPATTDLLGSLLTGASTGMEERRMAAYLLNLRGDPRSVDALFKAATQPRFPEIAGAALVALGGIDHPEIPERVMGKISDRSATVRAAAAVACTRFRRSEDLLRAREVLRRRLEAGEPDNAARYDLTLAHDEIGLLLRDREDLARGAEPRRRPPPEWMEADAKDLFLVLGRAHRQRVLDLVNLRVLQVLMIDGLFDYRTFYAPSFPAPDLGGGGGGESLRFRRENQRFGEQYDVCRDLLRRPFYTLEDDPDAAPPPVPREPR